MAENSAATLTAARGLIFLAPSNTASPTDDVVSPLTGTFDPTALDAAWVPVGHTSREDLPAFGFDGGDTETRGSWQAEVLKEVTTDVASDYLTFNVLQFDNETLSLYYGAANSAAAGARRFTLASAPGVTERSLLVVILDGDASVGFYAPKVSIRREDAISLATDDFGVLPLRATILSDGTDGPAGATKRFDWIGGEIEVPAVP